jgi:hypothetical protein
MTTHDYKFTEARIKAIEKFDEDFKLRTSEEREAIKLVVL